jgi:hypothetical protein
MGKSGEAARRAQKIAAIAAAGVVLLGGATVTSLAAWTDNEYVQGGVGDEPGIGTSTFEVQQNTTGDPGDWTDEESAPGGVIDFGVAADSLSPGTTIYGVVGLQTTADTTVGGTLSLRGATSDGDLFDALTYGARIVPSFGECDEDGYGASVTGIQGDGASLADDGDNTFTLLAASGDTKWVCFAITLADDADDSLQGQTSTPVWHFEAISD